MQGSQCEIPIHTLRRSHITDPLCIRKIGHTSRRCTFVFCCASSSIQCCLYSVLDNVVCLKVRHEANAVFAADAVARLSGTVGVAVVTAGPGLTNTITAVKNAQMAESPILLMGSNWLYSLISKQGKMKWTSCEFLWFEMRKGGAAANLLKGRGALQDIDQMSLFKSLCKHTATVKYVRDIPSILRKAIQISQSGTPGPVFVEFPIDTLYPFHIIKREMGVKNEAAKSISQAFINMYLNNYLYSLFAGAFVKQDCSPLKPNIKLAQKSDGTKQPIFFISWGEMTLKCLLIFFVCFSFSSKSCRDFVEGQASGLFDRKPGYIAASVGPDVERNSRGTKWKTWFYISTFLRY